MPSKEKKRKENNSGIYTASFFINLIVTIHKNPQTGPYSLKKEEIGMEYHQIKTSDSNTYT